TKSREAKPWGENRQKEKNTDQSVGPNLDKLLPSDYLKVEDLSMSNNITMQKYSKTSKSPAFKTQK
ncbi:hypothetical protein DVA81_18225, partial [Acinetobacter baumannii]